METHGTGAEATGQKDKLGGADERTPPIGHPEIKKKKRDETVHRCGLARAAYGGQHKQTRKKGIRTWK